MKKKFKGVYLLLSSIIIGVLHLPVAFAKSTGTNKLFYHPPVDSSKKTIVGSGGFVPRMKSVYDSLHLNLKGLSQQAFDYAKEGFDKLIEEGRLINNSIISIIDFSKPSHQKRLYVIDMANYKVLFHELVAHGRNTGVEMAQSFSNQNESFKSSPGFYITQGTYEGKNGYSMRLQGIERGINDKALERGIVMHGAPYVNESIASQRGWIGRSHGCPAVPPEKNKPIINTIKNGSCLFIYHPDYVDRSVVLN